MDTLNIERIKGWMQQCTTNHESCQKQARLCTIWSSDNMHIVRDIGHEDAMPRRLLKFSADLEACARLVEVKNSTGVVSYLALSHRWGPNEACTCTEANLEDLQKNGLPIKDLPKTYRDAITVAIKLGFEYIWIDSLCIIQDNAEDWKEEAPRMAVIYGSAALTIAAMDAKTNDGGLFVRDMAGNARGSLESRAWVMQERMISPRSLIFTGENVEWECRESDADSTESRLVLRKGPNQTNSHKEDDEKVSLNFIPNHPKELFTFFRDFRLPGVKFDEEQHEFMAINSDLLGERDDYEVFLQAWWKFISLYTPRQLTYGKDKFLAMNGVAAVPIRWTQMKNTFGLWYHFIEHELLWNVDPEGPEAKRPTTFRVPSWSWANLDDGRVTNRYYERLPLKPHLMVKPQFMMPVGTSFDQQLPIPAWVYPHYIIKMSGSFRSADILATVDKEGKRQYTVTIDPVGRMSDGEKHSFMPDTISSFPIGEVVKVVCLHMVQYQKEHTGLPYYLDINIVLVQANSTQEIKLYEEDVPEADLVHERTFRRVGYMETTYDEMRDRHAIWEDAWWRYLVLV